MDLIFKPYQGTMLAKKILPRTKRSPTTEHILFEPRSEWMRHLYEPDEVGFLSAMEVQDAVEDLAKIVASRA